MLVFKERRFALLLLAVLLSAILIWRPWRAVDPRVESALGWPARYARGLRFGVDIIGGSRIILGLEAYQVTIEIQGDLERTWYNEIVPKLEDNLYVNIKTVVPPDPITRRAVAEIGRPVSENLIEKIIGGLGKVVKVEKRTSPETCDEVIEILTARVDPAGLRGARFISLGANLVLYEIPGLLPGEAEVLLGKPGRLEIFFEDEVLLRGEDIVSVETPRGSMERARTAELPFRLTDEGALRFSTKVAGKADHPTVIYVDRPVDAIVLFDEEILGELRRLEYDPNERMFKGRPLEVGIEYFIRVSAVGTPRDELSPQARQFLEAQRGFMLRILLMGVSPAIVEEFSPPYSIENIPRLGEDADDWVERACGVKSVVTISPDLASQLAAGRITKELMITITRPTLEEAMGEARSLRIVLSERLPVNISYESETSIEARLGAEFIREVMKAAILALIGVWMLIYLRYRRLVIGFAIIGTMVMELVITLGAASVLGWSIGLPELAGLIIVIGTGVDHQIIITDEVMRGGIPGAKAVSLGGRVSRAFGVIFVAVATTVAAMISLAWLGFGAMRGFAIITITGLLIAVFLTRPVYARILTAVLARSAQE